VRGHHDCPDKRVFLPRGKLPLAAAIEIDEEHGEIFTAPISGMRKQQLPGYAAYLH
jgi:hypothetical protein